jgi:BirA family biotin operon repressor/biotin-[acetyl-CoA-carboxylase] ligase
VAPALCAALVRFEREGFAACRAAYEALDFLRGRAVDVLGVDGHTGWSGTAAGVDDSGALIVHTAQGPRAVSAGEVSIRLPSPCVGS